MKISICAEHLQIGDVMTATGETVTSIYFNHAGMPLERKKVYLRLANNGKIRSAEWNKATRVAVERS